MNFSNEVAPLITGLEDGWIPGRKMDLFDSQWTTFRSTLPLLWGFGIAHSVVSLIARRKSTQLNYSVQLFFGIAFVCVLHGYRALFIGALVLGNFVLTIKCPPKYLVGSVWIYNLAALVVVSGTGVSWKLPSLAALEGLGEWAHHFNMVMLKMISFGLDYSRSTAHHVRSVSDSGLDYKRRQDGNRDLREYSLSNYLTYVFFAPLYIAGPIASFNAFQSQMLHPQTTYSNKGVALYAIRWGGIFLLMEVFTHYMYGNAIAAQQAEALNKISSPALAIYLSIFVLYFMWMKFLLIWRFFRLWSLVNGIETPENMQRCVMNNYSIAQFWKSWHASFNVWLIRYVYIPLGGSAKRQLLNTAIIFVFVALWHDLNWRVFHWAGIVSAIFAPELIGTALWRKNSNFLNIRKNSPNLAKTLKALGCMWNILLMMTANLVGYVFGVEGIAMLAENIGSSSLWEFVPAVALFYPAASLMLWLDARKAAKQ